MEKLIKNVPHSEKFDFVGQVQTQTGQIASKTLSQNDNVSVTIFAFDMGEEISSHESGGDALVLALEGTGRITIAGESHVLSAGEAIVMPKGIPHAVCAIGRFKMLLTVIFPGE